jgi:hypothetical protein
MSCEVQCASASVMPRYPALRVPSEPKVADLTSTHCGFELRLYVKTDASTDLIIN